MSVQKAVPVSTGRREEEEEEDLFIRESRDVGAEFVRFFLKEESDVVSKGPDDAKAEGEGAAQSVSNKEMIQKMGKRIQEMGDELEPEATEIILRQVAANLSSTSIFKFSRDHFWSLCSSILSSCSSLLVSGWQQVSVVYQVMGLAVRELRRESSLGQMSDAVLSRQQFFESLPGDYMRDSGLEEWVQRQGGLSAITEPVTHDETLACVNIPDAGSPV